MAVLALGFAGQAIGGAIGGSILGVSSAAIGGFIGSTIGGLIDNMLFPQKMEGPRLDDLTVTVSTYGKPLPLMYGPENRIAGNIIWSTGLIETKKKSKQGGKGGPSVQVTEYSYRASFAVALGEGVISRVRKVWANNKLIYDDTETPDVDSSLYSALRVYPGDFTQNPDPTVEAEVGVGQTPAYRGTAYVVFADLQLADFGNRIPNLEFLVEAHEEIHVAAVVSDIVRRCGLSPNAASSVTVTDTVRGFAIGAKASGVGALQPLALAFDFDVGEVGGALRCQRRGAGALGTVLAEDLGGHEGAQARPKSAVEWTRGQVTALPREAVVSFPDPERDWQPNSQRASRSEGSADSALSTELAIVMSADEGRRLADRMLWEAWTSMQTAETSTDDRWIGLQPGRLYYFETPAGFEPLRITSLMRGWNGVIELGLRRDRGEVYLGSQAGASAVVPENEIRLPGLTEIIMLDVPLLLDADEPKASGFYWGFVGSGAGWRGADFLRGVDSSGPFENIEPQGRELTAGEQEGAFAAPAPGYDSADEWDDVTVLRVVLRRSDMTLESVSDDEVLAGANAAYVGPSTGADGEIIQFGVATPVSPGVYDLSHLRRGQRGTEFAWSDHADGDLFVLLELGALKRADFGLADLGLERWFKGVSLLTYEADTDAVAFTNTGAGLRPYSPVSLDAVMLGGGSVGDIELTWVRRSRIGWPEIDPPPLAEESERYLVRIMDGASVVRETETTAPTFLYTEAMQTADFGAPVTDLDWRVAQISAAVGPGVFAISSGPV